MSDRIRDVVNEMLGASTPQGAPQRKAVTPLTRGEMDVLKKLRANAEIAEALKQGRLERHLLRGIMADVLPLPISIVERLTGKFMGLLETGHLSARTMEPSKALTEAMGDAEDHASDADLDDIGMYGVGSGADIDDRGGDADDGVNQGEDHGDDSETADKGYMDEEKDDLPDHLHQKIFGEPKDGGKDEAEGDDGGEEDDTKYAKKVAGSLQAPSEADGDEDEPDIKPLGEPCEGDADTMPPLTTQPDTAKEAGEGDQGPVDLGVEEEGDDETPPQSEAAIKARAEKILSQWRDRYRKVNEALPKGLPAPKVEAYRRLRARNEALKTERKGLKKNLKSVKETLAKIRPGLKENKSPKLREQRKALKAEKRALKSSIRRLKAESRRIKTECRKILGPVTEAALNPVERKIRQYSEEIRTLRGAIRRVKEQKRALKARLREDDRSLSNETPDADPGADYDKLQKVDGVSDYSKGGAKIEAEGGELHPEDPGDGSKGKATVVPSDDTRDALETAGDETDPQNLAGKEMDLGAKSKETEAEGGELKPEEPGEGSVGKTTSPAKDAKIVKGVGQNEKARKAKAAARKK